MRQTDKFFIGVDEAVAFMKSEDLKTLFLMSPLDWRSYQLLDPQSGDLLWYHTDAELTPHTPVTVVNFLFH